MNSVYQPLNDLPSRYQNPIKRHYRHEIDQNRLSLNTPITVDKHRRPYANSARQQLLNRSANLYIANNSDNENYGLYEKLRKKNYIRLRSIENTNQVDDYIKNDQLEMEGSLNH